MNSSGIHSLIDICVELAGVILVKRENTHTHKHPHPHMCVYSSYSYIKRKFFFQTFKSVWIKSDVCHFWNFLFHFNSIHKTCFFFVLFFSIMTGKDKFDVKIKWKRSWFFFLSLIVVDEQFLKYSLLKWKSIFFLLLYRRSI